MMNKQIMKVIAIAFVAMFFTLIDRKDAIFYLIIYTIFVLIEFTQAQKEHESKLRLYRINKNTQMREVENENKYHETILSVLIQSMTLPVLFVDKEGFIAFTNQCFRTAFQIPHLRGKNYQEVFSGELYALVDRCYVMEKPLSSVICVENGYFHVDSTPVFIDEDKLMFDGTIIIFTDISQVKELENMQKQFLSDISHELKTPMSAIIGSAEILKRDGIESKEIFQEFVDILLKESYRMQNIVQDILELSRLDQARVHLNYQEVNMKELIKETVDLFDPLAREKQISLIYQNDIKAPVILDLSSIRGIMNNLVSNAIKYSHDGVVMIKTEVIQNHFVLTVKDEGIGISKEEIPHIFNRFYQVDKARSSKISTGLGLSIVQKTVELNKGTIQVESTPGIGTTFIVKIPV